MKKLLLLLILLSWGAGVMLAQEDADCSAEGLNRTIDLLYSNYAVDRSDSSQEGAFRSAERLIASFQGALSACRPDTESNTASVPGITTSDIGDGSAENPYAFGYAAETTSVILRVVDVVNPALEMLQAETPDLTLEENQNYIVVRVEATCPRTARNDCELTLLNFGLQVEGAEPLRADQSIYLPDLMVERFLPGRSRSGTVVFFQDAPSSEADAESTETPRPTATPANAESEAPTMVLVFYPNPDGRELPIYFELP